MPGSVPCDPSACAAKVVDILGEEGKRWLERLPVLLADCAERWGLSVLPPFPVPSYNYVTPVLLPDGTSAVLKVCPPWDEFFTELDALSIFDGRGMARLLDADRKQGVLLLERLLPGTSLGEVQEDGEAVRIAAEVMQLLWRPAPQTHAFPSVQKWADGFARLRARHDGGTGPLPGEMVALAEALFARLIPTGGQMLIHGDMNPGNILRAERQPWLAIDPKGVVGSPLFDVATFLNDPPTELDNANSLQCRITQFAGLLGAGQAEIAAWGCAQAVLSGWWLLEDHGGGWEKTLERAALYPQLECWQR